MFKQRVLNHFRYSFWIYIIIVVASIAIWDILFTVTAHRAPEDKKIEFYIANSPQFDVEGFNDYLENIRISYMPDMEEIRAVGLIDASDNDVIGNIQLNTFIFSNQGDFYIISRERYKSYAGAGAFVELSDFIKMNNMDANSINFEKAFINIPKTEEQEELKGIFAIPLSSLQALKKYGANINDTYICLLVNNGNDNNCLKLLQYLIQDK